MIDKMKSLGYKIMLEIIKETGFIYFNYTKICLSIICIVRKYFQIKPIWNDFQKGFSDMEYDDFQEIVELIDTKFGNDI